MYPKADGSHCLFVNGIDDPEIVHHCRRTIEAKMLVFV